MKNILVPCDFSKPSLNALRFAMDVATQSKGVVTVLNVIELPVIHDPIIMPVVSFEKDFLKELREQATERLGKVIGKYESSAIAIKPEVAFGSPSAMIQDQVRKKKADIIIMGSHGATGMREYFIGSNAEKVVRNSTVPVFVTKDYYKGAIQDIVFPNTLETEKQEKLIDNVKDLQSFFKAKLHILYVNTPANFTADNVTMARLKDFAKRFAFKNYTLNIYNYLFEDSGIIEFTKSVNADMIAMGTHGRKGLAHFLNGSLAEDVVNHASCPIWTFAIK